MNYNDLTKKQIISLHNDALHYITEQQERIDKAIEYIKRNQARLPMGFDEYTYRPMVSDEVVLAKELLDILQGSDKEWVIA